MVTITSTVLKTFGDGLKMRLAKFRGISKKTFYLHLKECEFRFIIEMKISIKYSSKN